MRQVTSLLAAVSAVALAVPANAHPHVFVDTEVEVVFDADGRAAAVRITWSYDEFFSMAIVEDRGFDQDFDGALTGEEAAALQGFDMNWDEGFAGDTYALVGATPVALGPPTDWTADYRDGKLVSTHLRLLDVGSRPAAEPLVVQSYDPGYYTAYRIVGTPVLTGADGCTAQIFGPDMAAADAILEQALEELNGEDALENGFPAVGAAYADEVRVTCADPS